MMPAINLKNQLILHHNSRLIKSKHCFKIVPLISLLGILMLIKIPALCQQFSPAEWKFESQREAIAPVSFIDSKTPFRGVQTLALKGGGKNYADGHWYKKVNVEPGDILNSRLILKLLKLRSRAAAFLQGYYGKMQQENR
jgi:hypothetical protein